MFTPSRDEARLFFCDTWRKYRAGEALSGLEQVTLQVLTWHPEYHALLDHPERHVEREYPPDSGVMNPFLHLSLHLAIEEQLSIDQPPGLRAHFERLVAQMNSHDAKHALLECLAETLWQAQRNQTALDENIYLDCLARRG